MVRLVRFECPRVMCKASRSSELHVLVANRVIWDAHNSWSIHFEGWVFWASVAIGTMRVQVMWNRGCVRHFTARERWDSSCVCM